MMYVSRRKRESIVAHHIQNNTIPLIVDLDGTLIKTDLLFESVNAFVIRHPLQSPRLIAWIASGIGKLKDHLSKKYTIDPKTLPYNDTLIRWLSEQKSQGRHILLATGSHRLLAESVAEHLGLFDEVLATEDGFNLKAQNKRDRLVSRYGEKGFDYIGNSSADLVIWQSAAKAYVVNTSPKFIEKVRLLGNLANVFDTGRPPIIKSLLKAVRPHQWIKNLLVFVPLLAAHHLGDRAALTQTALAFLVFGVTASSVYILNDLSDIANDRHHPRKRYRPFAAGDLCLTHGWLAWPLLLLAAFTIAGLWLPWMFVLALATYFILTLAYSLRLKQSAIIDVIALAALYTLRIIAGALATGIKLSVWLLAFSMFIFLSLAFVKRFAELKSAHNAEIKGIIRGRGYQHEDLGMISSMGVTAGYLAVLVLALYVQDSHTAELYHSPKIIWLACPLLLFWISRIWLMTNRGEMDDDPILFALKDRISWFIATCFMGVFCLAEIL